MERIKINLESGVVTAAAVSLGLTKEFFMGLMENSEFFSAWQIEPWGTLSWPARLSHTAELGLVERAVAALGELGWKPTTAKNKQWNFDRNGGWPLRLSLTGSFSLALMGDRVETAFPGEKLLLKKFAALGLSVSILNRDKPHGVLLDIFRSPKVTARSVANIVKAIVVADSAKRRAPYGLLPWNDFTDTKLVVGADERFTVVRGTVKYSIYYVDSKTIHVLGDYTNVRDTLELS